MRAVVTRVKSASVTIAGEMYSGIGEGFLVLLGVSTEDTENEAEKIADRICNMRVFADENGKMNLAPVPGTSEILIISQFTLFADCRQRRPGFTGAAGPQLAEPLYEYCVARCRERGFTVKTGVFGADMQVASINDGPVTIILDTKEL